MFILKIKQFVTYAGKLNEDGEISIELLLYQGGSDWLKELNTLLKIKSKIDIVLNTKSLQVKA